MRTVRGKQTIADAIDFVGNGRVGSLERRGLGVLRPYWATLGMSHGDDPVEPLNRQPWTSGAGVKAKGAAVTAKGTAKAAVPPLATQFLQLVQGGAKEKADALAFI